jgi:hypothetical protein
VGGARDLKRSLHSSGWSLTAELRAWAEKEAPRVNLDRELQTFTDYWLGTGKPMANWDAVFRNWVRRAPKMGGAMYSPEEMQMRALMQELTAQGFRRAFVHETAHTYRAAFEASRTHTLPQRDLKCIASLATAKRMKK